MVTTAPSTAPRGPADFAGRLIRPGDADYDSARSVWNGMVDRRPVCIARCASTQDVVNALLFARQHDLRVAVRGGGHNVAGHAVCDDGLVIDLSALRSVTVDPTRRIAVAQGGATWGDFDRATQAHGLACTGGEVSSTGIAGLTLGGGIGWLMGRCGLACDNLQAVEVVTASGQVLRSSQDERPELLWALRGGGGNFGVVTKFEYGLHPVGPLVAGPLFFPLSQATAFLQRYAEWTAAAPDELTIMAMLVALADGSPAIGALVVYSGDVDAGERCVEPMRRFAPPLVDDIRVRSYVELQSMLDATAPAGRRNYWRAHFARQLHAPLLDALVDAAFPLLSPYSSVLIEHLHGAVTRVPTAATAFGLRNECYSIGIFSVWTEASEDERHTTWACDVAGVVEPFAVAGGYVNYLGADATAQARAAYGPNYERLTQVKRQYDPDNFFRFNHNIVPAQRG